MQSIADGVKIELIKGDIASQADIMAVVNAANAQLRSGGGVAGALHRAAGPNLAEECRSLAPIEPGQAVISGGHELPNEFVIHTLGPVYGADRPEDELLASCYRNSLERAEENGMESIAFPAISTGAFGYPLEDATKVAIRTILDATKNLKNVRLIRFVLFNDPELEAHKEELSSVAGDGGV